jgi:hypothetical protein
MVVTDIVKNISNEKKIEKITRLKIFMIANILSNGNKKQ